MLVIPWRGSYARPRAAIAALLLSTAAVEAVPPPTPDPAATPSLTVVAWQTPRAPRAAVLQAMGQGAGYESAPVAEPGDPAATPSLTVVTWTPQRAPRAAIQQAQRNAGGVESAPSLPDATAMTVVAWRTGSPRWVRAARQLLHPALAPQPGAISGTLSATLGALTDTGTGTVAVAGAASKTLAALAVSGAGVVGTPSTEGVLSRTLAALTSSSAGTVSVSGSLAKTLGALTLLSAPEFLPVAARDSAEAVEWYLRIGSGASAIRVGTRDFVGPSWAEDPDDWMADPNDPTQWVLRETYRAAIVRSPEIERSLGDASYGILPSAAVPIELVNLDGSLDGLWGSEGAACILWRHDRLRDVTVRELDGALDSVGLAPGLVRIVLTDQDPAALETMIPRRLTSTEYFGPTCPDVGVAFPVVLGAVENLPLPYVVDDLPTSTFWHLVCEGVRAVTTVRRNRIGTTQLEDLDPTEWSAFTADIGGSPVTVIRTPRRQSATGGGFLQLYADVSGPSDERIPPVTVARVLNDPVWGGGLPIDAANIVAQAAAMPAAVRIDGALGWDGQQRRLRDVLDQILQVNGGRLQFDAILGWQVYFDSAAPATARLVLRDDAGPGEKTLLSLGQRVSLPRDERVSVLRLQYAPDYAREGEYQYTTSDRAVGATGRVKVLGRDGPGDWIRDRDAADWIAGYRAVREADAADRVVDAVASEEGRRVQLGDIVHLIAPQLLIGGEDRRVVRASKGSGRQRLVLERWSRSQLYSPAAGALPTVRAVSPTAGAPVAPLVTQDLAEESVSASVYADNFDAQDIEDTPGVSVIQATITTMGGVVDVTGTVYVDGSARLELGTVTASVRNVDTSQDGPGDFWWVDSTALRAWTLTPRMTEQPPAGTYTYEIVVIGGFTSGTLWQKTAAGLSIVERRR